ncbi:hypothetical protein RirG_075960 [Rhizophagus irregularis DAOM 197198w]|uniref:Uncharacterized protein n=1 Tax=Rhizophagus irregularis (strain DAOM 197198w) TaxID=1432141 RepID=A0A015LGK2_RHIIW|nr:hypothetical protein RirG_075960 [Rhizophagus irregularis DAOM 197198w]
MEVTSQNLQCIQQDMESLSIGSICKQNQHPTSPLLCMENRSVYRRDGCFSAKVVQNETMVEPSLGFYSTDTGKTDSEKGFYDYSGSDMAVSPMVPVINKPINRSTDIDLLQQNSLPIITSPNTPLRNPQWKLLACNISGLGTKTKAFQIKLLTYSHRQWIIDLQEQCLQLFEYRNIGVTHNTSIPLLAL